MDIKKEFIEFSKNFVSDQSMSNQSELSLLIEGILQKARESWGGEIGEERATVVKELLSNVLPNWSEKLGISELDLLKTIEKNRFINVVNHYQACNFPLIENIDLFETADDFKRMHKGLGFRCPSCKGISSNPQECNADTEKCNWKSYGLFGCLGEEYKFIVKDQFFVLEDGKIYTIFKPVAQEQK